jgi:phosphonate transport system substrate-binding protein
MTHRLRAVTWIGLAVLALSIPTVPVYRAVMDLTTPYPAGPAEAPTVAAVPRDTVYVGVISRYPSSVIYRGYQPVMDYLTSATGRYFALRLGGSYEETVQQLVAGRVSAAFLGAYLYVKAHDEHGVVCVVQPLNEDGVPSFRSVLITREGSDIHALRDLAGRRVAVPPELSYSAHWLLTRAVPAAGLDASSITAVRYLPHHHAVVYELLRGNVDAGVVKDRVAREFVGRGVRVVATSDPIPGAPIVVAASYDRPLAAAISTALLALHPRDPSFATVTAGWDAEFANGFTLARDADYDGLRSMLRRRGR